MTAMRALLVSINAIAFSLGGCAVAPLVTPPAPKPVAEILAASPASDWRPLDPQHTLYMDLPSGRVVIELAPAFAPRSVENIRMLVRQKYFDGLSVNRVQDNFVAQWGDPDEKKPIGAAQKKIAPEFTRAMGPDITFTPLPDRDVYAPQTGFAGGFPAARDPEANRIWLTHCYASVGVGRDNDADSGNGAELYAVIGNAPRFLDRNINVVGRIVRGIELLSTLPRGTGNLGFYEKPEQRLPIQRVRLMADVPEAERVPLEILRTDSETFRALVEQRRFRRDDWYKVPAGATDVCAVSLPARVPKTPN
jgi:peptidylprolyl isomerase